MILPPPPPPPSQAGWSAGIQDASQLPPSYDQVIHEKTQEEHVVRPVAAPRRFSWTSSATQTDPVRVDSPAKKKTAGKKPQKPPRPSPPKPLEVTQTAESVELADEKVETNISPSGVEEQSDCKSGLPNQTGSCTRSVTVYWDLPSEPQLSVVREDTPTTSHVSPRPTPLPRTKCLKKASAEETEVQPLVKISENSDSTCSDPKEVQSNEYLKELLEAFTEDNEREESGDLPEQSDEDLEGGDADGEMTTSQSQRNIRARIQAFESQAESANGPELAKPEPQPRKSTNKPPVAAKPSIALKPTFNHTTDDDSQNVLVISAMPQGKPNAPKKPAASTNRLSIKEELEAIHSNRSHPPVLTRANSIYEEESSLVLPTPPPKPHKEPLKPNLNINNHNSTSVFRQNEYTDSPNAIQIKPVQNTDSGGVSSTRPTATRRPTTIRVPSKTNSLSDNFEDKPPPLPTQKPVGDLGRQVSAFQDSFHPGPDLSLPPRRLTKTKTLPPRPPPAKTGPGRPPPPSLQSAGRSQSWNASQKQKLPRKCPVLPRRPNPGHRLYNKYTLPLPHGIAAIDHNGSSTGGLSFQKNEVLLLLEEVDLNTFECQVGGTRGRAQKSHMKIITPLDSASPKSAQQSAASGMTVQAIFDFSPEGPGELALRAGDVATMVEQVDSEWYSGTCRGASGFFPASFVKVLSNSPKPLPERKPKPPTATVSGPRCVARFDFEGEHSDELSFFEGDVIKLKAYVGQEWARGQVGTLTGIFPLNFVEIVEDLPPPASEQQTQSSRIALPGMVASTSTQHEDNESVQVSQSGVEWVVAQYDFAGNSDGDLSFQQGDYILITRHIDSDWSSGRLRGREGIFPRAFVQSCPDQQSSSNPYIAAAAASASGGRARALFDFASDCEEELSLKVGDVITGLESVDEEWFLGDLRGKRALVPKNYLQVLE